MGIVGFGFFQSGAPALLEAPTGLAVTARSIDANDVSWNTLVGAAGYEVRSTSDGGSTWLGGGDGWTDVGNVTSYVDAAPGGGGLPTGAGQTIGVQVRGYETAAGVDSGEASATVSRTMPTYQVPTGGGTSASGSALEVTVSWTAAGTSQGISPDGYYVQIAENSGFTVGVHTDSFESASPKTFVDGVSGVTLNYDDQIFGRVRTRYTTPDSSAGNLYSAYHTTGSDFTREAPVDAPTGLSTNLVNIDVITASWTNDGLADGTEYRVRNGGSVVVGPVDVGAASSVVIDDGGSGLPTGSGQTLTVEVRHYTNSPAENSNWVGSAETMPTFGTPTMGSISASGKSVTGNYTNAGASQTFSPTGVTVQRKLSAGATWSEITNSPDENGSPFTDTAPDFNESYDYRAFSFWRSNLATGSNPTGQTYNSAGSDSGSVTTGFENFTINARDEAGTSDGVEVQVTSAPSGATVDEYFIYYRVNLSMSGDVANGTLWAHPSRPGGGWIPSEIESPAWVDLDGFTTGQDIYIIVQADDGSGRFAQSGEEVQEVQQPVPGAISTVDAGWDSFSYLYVTASCTTSADATSYDFEIRARDDQFDTWSSWGFSGCKIGQEAADDTDPETEASPPSSSREFQYRARGVNAGGSGAWTESSVVTSSDFLTTSIEPGDCI